MNRSSNTDSAEVSPRFEELAPRLLILQWLFEALAQVPRSMRITVLSFVGVTLFVRAYFLYVFDRYSFDTALAMAQVAAFLIAALVHIYRRWK